MELLERYIKEIENDLKIDEFNVKQVQLTAPAKKHFWAARLIRHKVSLDQLKKERAKFKKDLINKIVDKSPIPVAVPIVERKIEVEYIDSLQKFDEKIKEQELIIEFLEKTEKIFNSLTFDIKNIISLIQQETM